MTKQDFEALAEAIHNARPAEHQPQMWASGCESARSFIARQIADIAAQRNPRFDRVRFLSACGVTDL